MNTVTAHKLLKKAIKIARRRGGVREMFYDTSFPMDTAPVCAYGALHLACGETDPEKDERMGRSSMITWLGEQQLESLDTLNDKFAPSGENPAEWALRQYLPADQQDFDVEGVDLEEDLVAPFLEDSEMDEEGVAY